MQSLPIAACPRKCINTSELSCAHLCLAFGGINGVYPVISLSRYIAFLSYLGYMKDLWKEKAVQPCWEQRLLKAQMFLGLCHNNSLFKIIREL